MDADSVKSAALGLGPPHRAYVCDVTEYDAVMNVNLRGNFNMAQGVIPHMRQRGGGAIVCISSIACLFLASDLSSHVTGVVLDVNGGLLIH